MAETKSKTALDPESDDLARDSNLEQTSAESDVAESDVKEVRALRDAYEALGDELSKVIVGQQLIIEQLVTALFAGGHCILIGVPGLAKTLLVSTLSRLLSLSFKRIQFTPDSATSSCFTLSISVAPISSATMPTILSSSAPSSNR